MDHLKKELSELLKRNDFVFEFIQQFASDGIAYFNPFDGRSSWVNLPFYSILGYNEEHLQSSKPSIVDLCSKEDYKALITKILNPDFQDSGTTMEVRWIHHNGALLNSQCHGLRIETTNDHEERILLIITKISVDREKTETLKMQYALLESSIESNKEVLIFSIDKKYQYLMFNSVFRDATLDAYGTRVVVGSNMLDSISDPEERQKAKANCDRALSGESHRTIEAYGNVNSGYFETHYSPIKNSSQEVVGVTVISTDITERVNADKTIIALNKDLEAFSYSIAHDLRIPLRAIDGYANILLDDHSQKIDIEGQRILNIISENARKMNKLIDDLLDFSRLGMAPVVKRFINPNDILSSIIQDQLSVVANKNIRFQIGRIEGLYCDPHLLKNVFVNLISNAVKYSLSETHPFIEIHSESTPRETTYCVSDNGIGFENKNAERIFQVFERLHTNEELEGMGMGLAIVQRIVIKHGGRTWAESSPGKGARFYFSLPVTSKEV